MNPLEGCKHELTVTLNKEDLMPHFEEAYRRAQKEVKMQGFRKGKVPLGMIKKKFGKQIRRDSSEDIANAEFNKIVREDELRVVGQPIMNRLDVEDTGLTFTITFDVLPEFELGEYKGITVDKPVKEITDADVDAEIERILLERGSMEAAETVDGDNFVVKATFNEVDSATGERKFEEDAEPQTVLLADPNLSDDLKALMRNVSVNDEFDYAPAPQGEGEQRTFKVTVVEVHAIEPAEFSNELVEEISGGRFVSTEEFRDELKKQIVDMTANRIKETVENRVVDAVVSNHDFAVPESLVREHLTQYLNEEKKRYPEQKLPETFSIEHFYETMRPTAEKASKWFLIRDEIIAAEKIELGDADYTAYAEEVAGQYNFPIESLMEVIKSDERIQQQLMSKKVIDTVVDFAIVNEVEA